jgi:hypothetical protein
MDYSFLLISIGKGWVDCVTILKTEAVLLKEGSGKGDWHY